MGPTPNLLYPTDGYLHCQWPRGCAVRLGAELLITLLGKGWHILSYTLGTYSKVGLPWYLTSYPQMRGEVIQQSGRKGACCWHFEELMGEGTDKPPVFWFF